jgi:hypothetical protein
MGQCGRTCDEIITKHTPHGSVTLQIYSVWNTLTKTLKNEIETVMSQPELRSVGNRTVQHISFMWFPLVGITYLLAPRSGVLLEKPTGSQPVNKFPAFYGTRRLITACTSDRHLFLSRLRIISLNHRNVYRLTLSWITIIGEGDIRHGLVLNVYKATW